MKRRFIFIAAAALMLAACADSSSSGAEGGTADLSGGSPRAAYNGAEELMGKSYPGFEMPASFEIPEINEVYEITYNKIPREYEKEQATELFKRFIGEDYDKRFFHRDDAFSSFYYNGEDANANCSCGSGVINMGMIFDVPAGRRRTGHYNVGTEPDTAITVGSLDTSVSQAAGFMDNELNTLLDGFLAPFEIRSQVIEVYSDGAVFANCALTLDGIPLQSWKSAYNRVVEGQGVEYFDCFTNGAEIVDLDRLRYLFVTDCPTVIEKKKLDQMISLKRAVGILQSELDVTDSYEFSDVRLMYCGLVVNPRSGSVITDAELDSQQQEVFRAESRTLTPTWCFFLKFDEEDNTDRCIKVDAVTGEVIYDIAAGA